MSGADLQAIVGLTALGALELDIANPSDSEFGLVLGERNAMFDTSFFQTVSSTSTDSRGVENINLGGGFRSGRPGGGSNPANSRENLQGMPLLEFIERVLSGIRENFFNFVLVGLGVSGIAYVVSRVGH